MEDRLKIFNIYVLKDSFDNVKYVGLTINKLSKRLNSHFSDIRCGRTKNKHKVNWFNRHNNNIKIEGIDIAFNKEDAFEKERYWIAKYRSMNINLINKTDGGEGCYGYKHSKETILSMSGENNHRFGKKHTDEWICEAKKRTPPNKGIKTNKPAHNLGISPSRETCEKIRNSILGSKLSDDTIEKMRKVDKSYLNKKVEAFIDNNWVLFESIKDASIKLNLNRQKISSVCSGNRKSTGGILLRYFDSNIKNNNSK